MDNALKMVLIFGVTLAVSLVLTPLVRRAAVRRGLLDMPGEERRIHKDPVPRLGGLAMYAAFAVGILLTFVIDVGRFTGGNNRFEGGRVLLMLVGAGIVTAVMAVDDMRGLRPQVRLLWQIGAALLLVVPSLLTPGGANPGDPAGTIHYDQGAGILTTSVQSPFGGSFTLSLLPAIAFTILWIVGMTNTVNWIDGLDGLAAGVSIVACAVLFVVTGPVLGQWSLSYLPLILGAATLGFLPYNIHPARIFMGDSGAMFLGFTLAVLSLIGGAKLAAALLVLGIPILDAVYLIVYRLYRGRSPLYGDRGHLHHRLLDIGLSQQQVVTIFYILSAAFGLLAVFLTWVKLPADWPFETRTLFKLSALAVLALVLIALLAYLARRQFDHMEAADKGSGRSA